MCGVAFRNFESAFPHLIDFARFKIGHTPRKFPVFANYCKRPPLASTHICRKKDAGSPFFTCFSILAQVFFKCKNFFRPPDFRLELSDFDTYICNNLYLIRGSVLLCLLQGTSVKEQKAELPRQPESTGASAGERPPLCGDRRKTTGSGNRKHGCLCGEKRNFLCGAVKKLIKKGAKQLCPHLLRTE